MSEYKIKCSKKSTLKSNGKHYKDGDTVELTDGEAKALLSGDTIKLFKLSGNAPSKPAPKPAAKPAAQAKPPEAAKPAKAEEKPKAPAQAKPSSK